MNFFTSTSLAMAIVGAGLVAVQGTWAEGRSLAELSSSKIVTGEVAQVAGEFHMAKGPEGDVTLDIVDKSYVITSQAGKEVRLELDDKTKVQNRVNPGDKVEAKISSKGHTLSVTRLER
jgi:methyl coenzyme M reductase beta subunit